MEEKMKLFKVLVFSVITIFSLNNIALAESALNKILSSGVLKAGTTGDFPPFSKRDTATNEYEGFDINTPEDLKKALEISKKVNFKF